MGQNPSPDANNLLADCEIPCRLCTTEIRHNIRKKQLLKLIFSYSNAICLRLFLIVGP
jgi:hypothetical protein